MEINLEIIIIIVVFYFIFFKKSGDKSVKTNIVKDRPGNINRTERPEHIERREGREGRGSENTPQRRVDGNDDRRAELERRRQEALRSRR